MNLLLDKLPCALEVGGQSYKIRTDFRTWIRIDNALFWETAPLEERIANILYWCYAEKMPNDLNKAICAAVDFYQCNGSEKFNVEKSSDIEEKEQKPIERQNRIYSFNYDAGLIYAAFQAQYGIDLCTAELHWWQFNAMFSGLSDNNKICKIMEFRSVDLSKFKDKEQKSYYRRMKQLYKLPDLRSEEEKEADMIGAFAGLF